MGFGTHLYLGLEPFQLPKRRAEFRHSAALAIVGLETIETPTVLSTHLDHPHHLSRREDKSTTWHCSELRSPRERKLPRRSSSPICTISGSSLPRSKVSRDPSSSAARRSSMTARYSASVRPTSASSSLSRIHLQTRGRTSVCSGFTYRWKSSLNSAGLSRINGR